MGQVAESWSVPVSGSSFYVWEENLRRLKKSLKLWAKTIPSPTQNKVKSLISLEDHQLAMEAVLITKEVIEREVSLHHDIQGACRKEEELWRQKSRILWLKVGDQNTTFFINKQR